ncbi:PRC-barrel domain-containing protein [Loktanella sp. SALINAS62]|uniref:PRC-barrel domain-containing protein n=1 Tax=Loktanella sp. SALINAS62 TaxID=2706124 RepID=UPI001B8D05FF|nr:PRC-barrel domain-containing protein [Loktanella sp. SALINAS62]MBS1302533.1 PRC-barrel domain containing protein [Loktanella sp. SALINAS62]
MKNLITTTAIAMLIASGAVAASHTTEEGVTEEGTMTDESTMTDDGAMTDDGTMTDDGMTDDTMTDTDTMVDDGAMTDDGMTDTTTLEGDTTTLEDETTAMSPMDGYSQVMNEDITAEELTGATVYGSDNEEVGDISDIVIADDGMIQQVIVDVGGFLGLGEKPVALEFADVTIMTQDDGDDLRVTIMQTEEELEEMPEYEEQM